ncbi:MAG: CapA family protein, partial [Acidobacteria bacterium]|nr:CapA family protein [Acidobacteriota bacterium]
MTRLVVLAVFAMAAAGQSAVRIVFAGDVMLDNGPGHVVAHGGDPFADVAAALKDGDFTVANLECAIVSAGEMAYKNYVFRGPKSALPLLHKYFSAVSLANNHTLDYGRKG